MTDICNFNYVFFSKDNTFENPMAVANIFLKIVTKTTANQHSKTTSTIIPICTCYENDFVVFFGCIAWHCFQYR